MRNLVIYLTALSALSSSFALRHGSHQLRDLLAFPKYQIDYLNELPLSASDAKACLREGVELESDFTQTRFEGRNHVAGNETQEEERVKVSHCLRAPSIEGGIGADVGSVGIDTDETPLSGWITSTRLPLLNAF